MFKATIDKNELQSLIGAMSEEDFARFLYCQEMAGTYLSIANFESILMSAMIACDRIKIQKALGPDEAAWSQMLAKKTHLESSTLGSLIKILERHDIDPTDIAYLRWIKYKRDYFVHRLFHEGAWPGELHAEDCQVMRRRLLAIQLWLQRGARNIWFIFERAGFLELTHLSDGSILAMNAGLYDALHEEIQETDADDRAS